MSSVFPATRRFFSCPPTTLYRARLAAGLALLVWTGTGSPGCRHDRPVSDAEKPPSASSPALFVEAASETGIDFQHLAGKAGTYFFPEVMAGAAALLDYDCDGDLDVLALNGTSPRHLATGGEQAASRLFRQDSPERFTDVTRGSGLALADFAVGVAVGDVNNDGYPDVYITSFGADRLLLNQKDGTFADVTRQAGIDNLRWGTSACFFDYDRDGWLDLYVTNYVDYYPSKRCFDPGGKEDYCGPQVFQGTADKLLHNESGRFANQEAGEPAAEVRFSDVSLESGIAVQRGPGLGVLSADFDEDGWADVYVANDGTANFLWMNQRDGTFADQAIPLGCAYDTRGAPQAGMGIARGDVDRDGHFDMLVTHLSGESNALYMAVEGSGFRDEAVSRGLAQASFPRTGFGTVLCDLEHDGDLDLVVANGRVKRPLTTAANRLPAAAVPESLDPFWRPYAEPNQIFINDGSGRFRPWEGQDPFTDIREVSRGLAAGDIDNDGDWDLLLANAAGKLRYYRNLAPKRGSWLVVRAVEPDLGGRDAYGAVVAVVCGDRTWRQSVNPASSYLSSSDPRVHFGLGDAGSVERIEIRWPDGSLEWFAGGEVNRAVELQHGKGNAPP